MRKDKAFEKLPGCTRKHPGLKKKVGPSLPPQKKALDLKKENVRSRKGSAKVGAVAKRDVTCRRGRARILQGKGSIAVQGHSRKRKSAKDMG